MTEPTTRLVGGIRRDINAPRRTIRTRPAPSPSRGIGGDIAPRRPTLPVRPPVVAPVPPPTRSAPAAPTAPTASASAAPAQPEGSKKRWVIELSLYPLFAVGAIAAAYSSTIGQWLVLAYGLFAIFTRRDSRLSFGIALFTLITIPIFQLIHQTGIASNAAIYTYELLVIGTIQAIIELRRTGRVHS